jgi:hypothetical protein
MKFVKILFAWLAASAITGVTGSIIQTQYNLAAIAGIGAPSSLAVRFQTTLQDLVGFAPAFAIIAAGAFLVAFPVAAWLGRSRRKHRTKLYAAAGAAVIATALLVMNTLLPVIGVGATRWTSGLLALSAAGALGGLVFARLARPAAT